MERVILVVALAAVAVGVAFLLRRLAARRTGPASVRPTGAPSPAGWVLPTVIDRAELTRPEAPWLVAVFTSETCGTCGDAWERARHLASNEVAVERIEASERPDLHERYRVEAVPAVFVLDDTGTVRRWFLGPPSATELWGAMAELRA